MSRLKICPICKRELPYTLEFFSRKVKGTDILNSQCRECKMESMKKYRQSEEYKEKERKWQKNYYYNNKKKQAERLRKTYLRIKGTAKYKEAKMLREERRRALKSRTYSNFSKEEWQHCKEHFGNKCAYCGETAELSQDHFIPISKGGEFTVNNIIPCCKKCNSSKGNKDFSKWYKQQPFYNMTKELKVLKYLNYNTHDHSQQLKMC